MGAMRGKIVTSVSVVTLLAILALATAPASAAPGSPGTPQAPTVAWQENFENAPHTGLRTMIDDYVAADGGKYSADPYWSDPTVGSGMVMSWTNLWTGTDGSGAGDGMELNAFQTLRQLTEVLGTINETTDPQDNAALSAYTQSTGPALSGNRAMFETTATNIAPTIPPGRFLIASVAAAATNCPNVEMPAWIGPQYTLSIANNGTETPLITAPIDPCTSGRPYRFTDLNGGVQFPIYGGVYTADESVLYTGGSLGVVVRNLTSNYEGNDGALDDLKLLDATPQLDKSFSVPQAEVGDTVRATFTITNTTDLLAKNGWSFADSLPPGLVVAANANVSVAGGGTATVNATPGATGIEITDGDLSAGSKSMTISLDVTPTAPGTFVNGPDNITTVGLIEPGDATLVVAGATVVVEHEATDGTMLATPVTSAGAPGDPYTTAPENFPGYDLVTTPPNAAGSYGPDGTSQTVTYVYAPDVSQPTEPPATTDPPSATAPPSPVAGPANPSTTAASPTSRTVALVHWRQPPSGTGYLAYTGADVEGMAIGALALLAAGVVVLLVRRRRNAASRA